MQFGEKSVITSLFDILAVIYEVLGRIFVLVGIFSLFELFTTDLGAAEIGGLIGIFYVFGLLIGIFGLVSIIVAVAYRKKKWLFLEMVMMLLLLGYLWFFHYIVQLLMYNPN